MKINALSKKILFFIFSVNLFPFVVVAQLKLPSVDQAPQSPVAAAFSRYGEVPVDYSTGVPRIEIPLYKVKVGDVEIPINITYHSSGIKVRDFASEVGLGFTLQTGGMITTTILGDADIDNNQVTDYKSSSEIESKINAARAGNQQTQLLVSEEFWRTITGGGIGFKKDHFSDRFYYSLITGENGIFRKDFQTGVIRFLPYRPLQVKMPTGDQPWIQITSSTGYEHHFQEFNKDFHVLKKVLSPDRKDSVEYFYSGGYSDRLNVEYSVQWQFEEPYVEDCTPIGSTKIGCLKRRPVSYSNGNLEGGMRTSLYPLLDSIVTKDVTVSFQYVKDRFDDVVDALPYPSYFRMKKIRVRDNHSGLYIQNYDLSHSYFGSAENKNRRLKLDKIGVSGASGEPEEWYSFAYNLKTELPPYPHLTSPGPDNAWYEDYWGYVNWSGAKTLLPYFLSAFNIPNATVEFGALEPNPQVVDAGILKEIKYPTGGRTIFEYEANDAPGFTLAKGGGLRIKKIKSYTGSTEKPIVKTYEYSQPYSLGIIPAYYKWDSPVEHFVVYRDPGRYWQRLHYSVFGKASSSSYRPIMLSNGMPVVYLNVTEYIGDDVANSGKTVFNYDMPKQEILPGDIDTRYVSQYHQDFGNYNPKLLHKNQYVFSQGLFQIVKSESYTYTDYIKSEFISGISLASKVVLENWSTAGTYDALLLYESQDSPNENVNALYLSKLVYSDSKAIESVPLLTSSVVSLFTNSGTVVTTSNFVYDDITTLLKEEIVTASNGQTSKMSYKYPKDFGTQEPYKTMVERNILSPVIVQEEFKDTKLINAQKTEYDFWNNDTYEIRPQTISTKSGISAAFEPRIVFKGYHRAGQIKAHSKAGGAETCYLYSYGGSLPIAKIENASYNSVVVALGGEVKVEQFRSRTNPSLADIESFIAPLRSSDFKMSLVSSYKHVPLIGLSSVTDPNGNRIYFEYDNSNRLSLVKNSDNFILKKYQYNYGEKYDTPFWVSTGNERCQPCSSNANFVTPMQEREEVDINRNSPSFSSRRWAQNGTTGTCTSYSQQLDAEYQFTATPPRCMSVNGVFTGYQEREQINVNPCSQLYNNLRWINIGINTSSCPATFYNTNQSGEYAKENCPAGYGGTPYYVSIPAGMFSSQISPEDAQSKATGYGHQQANAHGQCQYLGVPFQVNCANYSGNGYYVEMINTSTNQAFYFDLSSQQTGFLAYVPAGTYNFTLNNSTNNTNDWIKIGCSTPVETLNGMCTVTGVIVSADCNVVEIKTN